MLVSKQDSAITSSLLQISIDTQGVKYEANDE